MRQQLCLAVSILGALSCGLTFGQSADAVHLRRSALFIYGGTKAETSHDRTGWNCIYSFDTATRVTEMLWDGSVPVHDIRVSPDETTISFIEPIRIENGSRVDESTLRLTDMRGVEFASIDGVRQYDWSPDSRQIVYQTGPYDENGVGFAPTGTHVYDIQSKESKRIAPGGYDVQWAQFNGDIYIWYAGAMGKDVLKYVPLEDRLEDTGYSDIFFSPGGISTRRPASRIQTTVLMSFPEFPIARRRQGY